MSKILSITTDEAQERDLEALLSGVANGVPRAISGAINKVLPKARTGFVRAVGGRVTLPAKAIRERIDVRKSTPAELVGLVVITRKSVPLIDYKARQTKAGVTVQVRKDAPRESFPSSFIQTMASGHKGVFRRRRLGDKRAPRLPIDERQGPTVHGVIENAPELLNEQLEAAAQDLDRQIDSQVDRLLMRRKGSS